MIRQLFIPICFLTACDLGSSQRGDVGAAGPQGEQGQKGERGPSGADGAPGVCDTSSCPSTTSVNGLSGGTLSSALSVPTLNVSSSITLDSGSSPAPHGIIVARGGKQTSINGFYCGKTSFDVNGLLGDQAQTDPPNGIHGSLRQAKNHCEVACNHAAAHPCLPSEIVQSVMLGGGSSSFTANEPNPAVPMPPSSASAVYWLIPADGNASCSDWPGGSTTMAGTAYKLAGNEGKFQKELCDQLHPLLCCL